MKGERCRATVAIVLGVQSADYMTSFSVKDLRRCQYDRGHRSKHAFHLPIVDGAKKESIAKVTW